MNARAATTYYAKVITYLSGDKVEDVLSCLAPMAEALGTSGELRNLLKNPTVSVAEKKQVLLAAAPLPLPGPVDAVVAEIIARRRTQLLPDIAAAARELFRQRTGVQHVEVQSASALSDEQKRQFIDRASRSLGKKVVADFTVNPGLIAGFIVRMGTTVYDNSVSRSLEGIESALSAVSRG